MKDSKLQRANKLFREGRYTEAKNLYDQVVVESPGIGDLIGFNVEQALKKQRPRDAVNKIVVSRVAEDRREDVQRPLEGSTSNSDIELIEKSGLFDPEFYAGHNPDVPPGDFRQLAAHFVAHGWKEGRNPSVKFDSDYYLRTNPTLTECSLLHYIKYGRQSGCLPCASHTVSFTKEELAKSRKHRMDARIAVHAHIFYPDLAHEIVNFANNMPVPYDLIVTTTSDEGVAHIRRVVGCETSATHTKVEIVPNVGRDLAPLFVSMREIWSNYDYICHLHSKKSPHAPFGNKWRVHLFDQLLGSPEIISRVLQEFDSDPMLGFMFPDNVRDIKPYVNWSGNLSAARKLFEQLCLDSEVLERPLEFAAGSMCWMRADAMKPLTQLELEDFGSECGLVEGTLAHVVERCMPLVPLALGCKYRKYIAGIQNPKTYRNACLGNSSSRKEDVKIVKGREITAYIDSNQNGSLSGWAAYVDGSDERVELLVNIDGKDVCKVVADSYREDLERNNISDGKCAFNVKLPSQYFDGCRHKVLLAPASQGVMTAGAYKKTMHFELDSSKLEPEIVEVKGALAGGEGRKNILVCAHLSGMAFGGELSFLDILDGLNYAGYNVYVTVPNSDSRDYLERIADRCVQVFVFSYKVWSRNSSLDSRVIECFEKVCETCSIHAVHVNTIMLREPLVAARNRKVPSIVHVRELILNDPALAGQIGLKPVEILSRVIESADYVMANSKETLECFKKDGKSYLLHNCIDVDEFNIDNNIAEYIYVGLISSNIPKKGIYDFVEVARIVEPKMPKLRFLMIGPKNGFIKKLEQARGSGHMPSNLSFVDYQESPVAAISMCNIVLNLSHFQESFGRTVLEAMAARRPVIGYKWGALPELISDGVNGYLVDFCDVEAVAKKLCHLCGDLKKIRVFGEEGRALARRSYTKKVYGRKIGKIYERVFSEDGPSVAVSVIIPNYNYSEYLEERILSIVNQSYSPFEIIFMDDASTDDSVAVAARILREVKVPYKMLLNKENRGVYRQWMDGIREARGDYVWIAEADDVSDREFLKQLVERVIGRSDIVLAYAQSKKIDGDGNLISKNNLVHTDALSKSRWCSDYENLGFREVVDYIFYRNTIPNVSACLMRKEPLREAVCQLEQFSYCGDWYLYARLLSKGKISYSSKSLNYFRRHDKGVTRQKQNSLSYLREVVQIARYVSETFPVHSKQIAKRLKFLDMDHQFEGLDVNSREPKVQEIFASIVRGVESRKRIVFVTTNDGSHSGGSEQLWVQAAHRCRERGHDVTCVIKKWAPEPYFISSLYEAGVAVFFKGEGEFDNVKSFSPDLIVISTGDQDEGVEWFEFCRENNSKYAVVSHLVKEPEYWPIKYDIRNDVKSGLQNASMVMFTSKNNHRIMEGRLESKIDNFDYFFNPYFIDKRTYLPFPSLEEGLKIAMPARLLKIHKGQDLALKAISGEKWKQRNITLNLYGEGPDKAYLQSIVRENGLDNVNFLPPKWGLPAPDLSSIWRDNHAILMPSFMEGMPIVLINAMIHGRVPIVTNVGGHCEVIEDNVSGFIAAKPTVADIEDALERAYQSIANLESIGLKSREFINSWLPDDPIDDFVGRLGLDNICS
jgi:glycosyltransferase involved in cell wall biosynthesis/GT2 family glycosyltransferase